MFVHFPAINVISAQILEMALGNKPWKFMKVRLKYFLATDVISVVEDLNNVILSESLT